MKNILLVSCSPRGEQSYSHQMASRIVDELKFNHPGARVAVRDLANEPLPHVGQAFVGALASPAERRTAAQARAIELSDDLVGELFAADVVVLAAPMYNFGVPSSLKAWVDHIVRSGRTFTYTQDGPQGLLKDKRVILVVSRGGVYSDGPMKAMDFQESYLRSILGFIGISDVYVVRVEGVAMGEAAVERAMASAREQAGRVTQTLA